MKTAAYYRRREIVRTGVKIIAFALEATVLVGALYLLIAFAAAWN